jgi:hypothetical protein
VLGDVQFCPGAGIRKSRSKNRLRLAFARSGICSEHKSGQFSASSRTQKLLSLKAQLTLPIRSGAFFSNLFGACFLQVLGAQRRPFQFAIGDFVPLDRVD